MDVVDEAELCDTALDVGALSGLPGVLLCYIGSADFVLRFHATYQSFSLCNCFLTIVTAIFTRYSDRCEIHRSLEVDERMLDSDGTNVKNIRIGQPCH